MEKDWEKINREKNETIILNMAINHVMKAREYSYKIAITEKKKFKEEAKELALVYGEIHDEMKRGV